MNRIVKSERKKMSNKLTRVVMMGGYGTFLNEIYIGDRNAKIYIAYGYIIGF